MTDEQTWIRYAGWAGIAFVVLTVVSAFLPGAPPAPDDPVDELRAFFVDHRNALLIGQYLGGLGVIVAFLWIAGLRTLLRHAEGGDGMLTLAFFAGGIAVLAMALVISVLSSVLALRDREEATFRALYDASNLAFVLIMFPWATLTIAASLVILRTGVLARWLGWAGFVAAAIMLISAIGLGMEDGAWMAGGPITVLAFILGMLWILATSILMLRASPAEQPSGMAAGAAV